MLPVRARRQYQWRAAYVVLAAYFDITLAEAPCGALRRLRGRRLAAPCGALRRACRCAGARMPTLGLRALWPIRATLLVWHCAPGQRRPSMRAICSVRRQCRLGMRVICGTRRRPEVLHCSVVRCRVACGNAEASCDAGSGHRAAWRHRPAAAGRGASRGSRSRCLHHGTRTWLG